MPHELNAMDLLRRPAFLLLHAVAKPKNPGRSLLFINGDFATAPVVLFGFRGRSHAPGIQYYQKKPGPCSTSAPASATILLVLRPLSYMIFELTVNVGWAERSDAQHGLGNIIEFTGRNTSGVQ